MAFLNPSSAASFYGDGQHHQSYSSAFYASRQDYDDFKKRVNRNENAQKSSYTANSSLLNSTHFTNPIKERKNQICAIIFLFVFGISFGIIIGLWMYDSSNKFSHCVQACENSICNCNNYLPSIIFSVIIMLITCVCPIMIGIYCVIKSCRDR